MTSPLQGDVWWAETPERKGRPHLVVSRDDAIPVLRSILVAPLTRTIRGIPTEVELGPTEGLPVESVASFDNLFTIDKALLTRRMGALPLDRRPELCAALRATADC